jgi:hypothetical protein
MQSTKPKRKKEKKKKRKKEKKKKRKKEKKKRKKEYGSYSARARECALPCCQKVHELRRHAKKQSAHEARVVLRLRERRHANAV